MHTAATGETAGSEGSGRRALAQRARTFPGVSAPSRVVRSTQRTARSRAASLASRLMDRAASRAARASAPTWSTPGSPCRKRLRLSSDPPPTRTGPLRSVAAGATAWVATEAGEAPDPISPLNPCTTHRTLPPLDEEARSLGQLPQGDQGPGPQVADHLGRGQPPQPGAALQGRPVGEAVEEAGGEQVPSPGRVHHGVHRPGR